MQIPKEFIGVIVATISYIIGRLTKQRTFTANKEARRQIGNIEAVAEKILKSHKEELEEIKKIQDTKARLEKIKELLEKEEKK